MGEQRRRRLTYFIIRREKVGEVRCVGVNVSRIHKVPGEIKWESNEPTVQ